MSYNYIPELDFYFRSYWASRGEITIDNVNIPVIDTDNQDLPSGSFLQLLFSQIFDSTSYTYFFVETEISDLSKTLRERIKVSGSTIKVYLSTDSTDEENIFSLEEDDFSLLSKLLDYRLGKTTSLTGIDYSSLGTTLSKLIYTYLDLVLNNNYSRFNNNIVISNSNNSLENLFELYVVNEAHKIIKNWTTILDANILELRLVHEVKLITSTIESAKEVPLSEIVYSYNLDIYHNGVILEPDTDYSLTIDTTTGDSTAVVTWITWEEQGTNIVEDDILVIEYYTKVDQDDVDTNAFVDGVQFQGGG